MANALTDNLTADITRTTAVVASATKLINGLQALIDAAVAKAVQLGATEAELKPISDLSDVMENEADALALAVVAHTPAEGQPPA